MRKQFALELNYSVESLATVDALLARMRAENVPLDDKVGETLWCIGCYVGEVFVRNANAEWKDAAPPEVARTTNTVWLACGEAWVNPIGKVALGEGEDLRSFYSAYVTPPERACTAAWRVRPWCSVVLRGLVGLVVVTLAACGTDSSVSFEDAPGSLRMHRCRYLARCHLVEDEATCLDLEVGSFHVDVNRRRALDAGKLEFDEGAAARCIESLGAVSCDLTSRSYRSFSSDDCEVVWRGTVGGAGECSFDDECTSGRCDVPVCEEACCLGTCAGDSPAERRAVGETCDATSECVADAWCDNTSAHVCVALKTTGEACRGSEECRFGMGCAATPVLQCGALPAEGRSCDGEQCRDVGLFCNAARKCQRVGLVGDPCLNSTECSYLYSCGTSHRCERGPRIGDSCDVNPMCSEPGSFCDATRICKGPQPDGAPCTTFSECDSNYCAGAPDEMTCQVEPVCI